MKQFITRTFLLVFGVGLIIIKSNAANVLVSTDIQHPFYKENSSKQKTERDFKELNVLQENEEEIDGDHDLEHFDFCPTKFNFCFKSIQKIQDLNAPVFIENVKTLRSFPNLFILFRNLRH